MSIKAVAVFCGAAHHVDNVYQLEAREIGRLLAINGMNVVYGGASQGLMGHVADAALEYKGDVYGYIPTFLTTFESAHPHATEMHFVDSMQSRKILMYDRADAFIILPGGFGTLEEVSEILSWRKIDLHKKPIIFVDTDRFWQPFFDMLNQMVATGFAPEIALSYYKRVASSQEAVDYIKSLSCSEPLRSAL